MAKIQASLSKIKTEFEPLEPGTYKFEITQVEEVEKSYDGEKKLAAYVVHSKVVEGPEADRTIREYINLRLKTGEWSEAGLAGIKRYFEATYGKEEVETWSDDDFDTDMLIGRQFLGAVVIDSYTPAGATEPKQKNEFRGMEPV